jgi:hypothetical protein
MLKITIESFDDLSEEERSRAPNNGVGKQWANYLRVTHDSDTLLLKSDAMEPEDTTFTRDMSWVVDVIRTVYQIGRGEPNEDRHDPD